MSDSNRDSLALLPLDAPQASMTKNPWVSARAHPHLHAEGPQLHRETATMLSFDPLDPEGTQHKFARRIAAPNAPAEGNGLPKIPHNVYDCIELCGDDLRAALLLFKMIFFCRNSTLTIEGKRWYVRGRETAVSPNRKC